jgi:autotransporter-associated beta strand protein
MKEQKSLVPWMGKTMRLGLALCAAGFLWPATAGAGSAQWKSQPPTNVWSNPANWIPATVPNSSADVATFDLSSTTSVVLTAGAQVDNITFTPNATTPYTLATTPIGSAPGSFVALMFRGAGIRNNSGVMQNFVVDCNADGIGSTMQFTGSSGAGSLTTFTTKGGLVHDADSGYLYLTEAASGENAVFINNGASVNGGTGGRTYVSQFATCANATFINHAGTAAGARSGFTLFFDNTHVDHATFINYGATLPGVDFGGATICQNDCALEAGTLIANGGSNGGGGGQIILYDFSTGGTSRIELFGNGNLDISPHHSPGVTVGSIEGNGIIFLGAKNLTVGSNNMSTEFSGTIQDGGANGGAMGMLTKIGSGTLTLSGVSTFSSFTTVNAGTLILTGSLNSWVLVMGGIFSGNGIINNNLYVGSGGIVDLVGGTLTVNGAINNNGLFILSNAAQLAGVTSFTNNGTLDLITAGMFVPPPNFTNNGVILDSSVVKAKTVARTGTTFTVTIDSYTGHTYQLQVSSSPAGNTFVNLGPPQQGSTGTVLTFTDPNATGSKGFYRIFVSP